MLGASFAGSKRLARRSVYNLSGRWLDIPKRPLHDIARNSFLSRSNLPIRQSRNWPSLYVERLTSFCGNDLLLIPVLVPHHSILIGYYLLLHDTNLGKLRSSLPLLLNSLSLLLILHHHHLTFGCLLFACLRCYTGHCLSIRRCIFD